MKHYSRRGQAMVELAAVLPILIVLICGVIDFARIFNAQVTLSRAAQTAANFGALAVGPGRLPSHSDVQAGLLQAVLPPLDASLLVVNSIEVGKADSTGRNSVVVDVSYDVPLLTPVISRIFDRGVVRVSSRCQRAYLPFGARPSSPVTPPQLPPFTIAPTNDVVVNVNCAARMKVVAKQLHGVDGTPVPLTLKLSTNGNSFSEIFGGNPACGGEEMVLSSLMPGNRVAISARAFLTGCINKTYRSNAKDAFPDARTSYHQYVLANGDAPPERPASAEQVFFPDILAPFVDTSAQKMVLKAKEVATLFEFNSTFNSRATDFQDLVVLLQFYDPATEAPPVVP